LTEGVVIVVSILLAFGIDAWWSAHGERVEERELLQNLLTEMSENHQRLTLSLVAVEDGVEDVRLFIHRSSDEVAAWDPDSAWVDIVVSLERTWSQELAFGVLDAATSSGRLAILKNARLRAQLAEVHALRQDVNEVLGLVLDLSKSLAAQLGGHAAVRRGISMDGMDFETSRAVPPEALQQIRSDPAIVRYAAAKYLYWGAYLYESRRLESHLRDLSSQLEGELLSR
jgi:hypothetical protein